MIDTLYGIITNLYETQEAIYRYIGQPIYNDKYYKEHGGITINYTNGAPSTTHVELRDGEFEFYTKKDIYPTPWWVEFDYVTYIKPPYICEYFATNDDRIHAIETPVKPGETITIKTCIKVDNVVLHYGNATIDIDKLRCEREGLIHDNLDNIIIKSINGEYAFELTQVKPVDCTNRIEKEYIQSFGNKFQPVVAARCECDLKLSNYGTLILRV